MKARSQRTIPSNLALMINRPGEPKSTWSQIVSGPAPQQRQGLAFWNNHTKIKAEKIKKIGLKINKIDRFILKCTLANKCGDKRKNNVFKSILKFIITKTENKFYLEPTGGFKETSQQK